MTAPLLTTRDRLAEALWDRYWSHDLASVPCDFKYAEPGARSKFLCDADALLASGAVVDVATLAEDEALVERIHRFGGAPTRGAVRTCLAELADELGSDGRA